VRLRNSVATEVLLLLLVYIVGVGIVGRDFIGLRSSTWYHEPVGGGFHVTAAGWWFALVSLPIFQFLIVRWYFRLFIWGRLLARIARLNLDLNPLHADRAGGLGFLNTFELAFVPFLVAQGLLAAGKVADDILYAGANLAALATEILVIVGSLVFLVICPLLVFGPLLYCAHRQGLRDFAELDQEYVQMFREKWLRGGAPPGEPLIGSNDIQSLADIANSYEVVKGMGLLPLSRRTIIGLVIVTLLPFTPLLLTLYSFNELAARALKLLI
jgi:hypothetical protein